MTVKEKKPRTKSRKQGTPVLISDDREPVASSSSCVVRVPKITDILCGKDKSCVSHPGSVNFREVIEEYREKYESSNKQKKMSITREIVSILRKSSRFLKYDSKAGVWKTITDLAARDKVSFHQWFQGNTRNSPLLT